MAGEQAGQEPHQRPRVPAIDRRVRSPQPAEPDAADASFVLLHLDFRSEGAHGARRRKRVRGGPEAREAAFAVGDRREKKRAVGDGLVAGHGEVASKQDGRADLHRAYSSSKAGDTMTEYPCASSKAAARRPSSSPDTSTERVPPRSGDMCWSSKSSMLICSAPSAWVIPERTPGRSGTCTRTRWSAPTSR